MKRLLLSLTLFTLLFSVPSASAHPGRTDASGGHYNRSTGEYHYHHGYSAHQHYDMDGDGKDDCPYNFKDKTGSSSGASSSSVKKKVTSPTVPPATKATDPPATVPPSTKATEPPATKTTQPPSTVPTASQSSTTPTTSKLTIVPTSSSPPSVPIAYLSQKNSSTSPSSSDHLPSAILFVLFVISVFCQIYSNSSHKRTTKNLQYRIHELELAYQYQLELNQKTSKSEKQYKDSLEECQKQLSNAQSVYESYSSQTNKALTERIEELTSSLEESDRKRKEFVESMRHAFGNDFLLQASGAPKETYWDEYGYPRCSSIYPDPYILHRSSTGRFHRPGCSHSRNCITIHALDVPEEEFYANRCQVCKPEYPDLSWKEKYRHLYKLTK